MTVKHPTVLWAQRSPHIYISLEVEDMTIEELEVKEDMFKFRGKHGTDQYEVNLQFYDKLKGEEKRQILTERRIELVLPKEKSEWWPRLLKEKTKVPWVRVDFNKWKDEDEETEEKDMDFGNNFGNMDFSSFGLPGGGGGSADLDDLDLDDDDMGDLEEADDDKDEPAKPEGTTTGVTSTEAGNQNGVTGANPSE